MSIGWLTLKIVRSVLVGLFLVPQDLAFAESERGPASVHPTAKQAKIDPIMESDIYQSCLAVVKIFEKDVGALFTVVLGTMKNIETSLTQSGWKHCGPGQLTDENGRFLFFNKEMRCFNPATENSKFWASGFLNSSLEKRAKFFASLEMLRIDQARD